jgi:hypothetical protein
MGDIEESIFKRNIPGKYSTWRDEAGCGDSHTRSLKEHSLYDDDDDFDDDDDDDGGSSSHIQQEKEQQFEDLSDLPIAVRDSILSERSRRHATGVKVLYQYIISIIHHHYHLYASSSSSSLSSNIIITIIITIRVCHVGSTC